MRSRIGPLIGVITLSLLLMVLVGNVVATGTTTGKLQIGAVTFVDRVYSADAGGCGSIAPGDGSYSILYETSGTHWASVELPHGATVTDFTYAVRDFSDLNSTARLIRKYTSNGANAFANPVIMATATSTGSSQSTRRFTDSSITNATINNGTFAYMAQIISCDTTIQPVSVIIEYTTP